MLKHVWTPKSSLFCTVHFLGPCTAGRGVLQHGRLLMHEHRQGCTIGTWSIITHLTLPCIIRERAVYDQNDMKNKPKKSQGSVMITALFSIVPRPSYASMMYVQEVSGWLRLEQYECRPVGDWEIQSHSNMEIKRYKKSIQIYIVTY